MCKPGTGKRQAGWRQNGEVNHFGEILGVGSGATGHAPALSGPPPPSFTQNGGFLRFSVHVKRAISRPSCPEPVDAAHFRQ